MIFEFQVEEAELSQLAVENCQRPLSRQVRIWIIPSVSPLGDFSYPDRMTFI